MVCNLPLLCDFGIYIFAVPLHSINLVRSQAAPRQRASSLRSACTDFVTQISISNLNRQNYGKDLCKWRRAGSEPTAQRK